MIKIYKNTILIMFCLTTLAYSKNLDKLKAEVRQVENNLVINISRDDKTIKTSPLFDKSIIIHKIKKGDTLSQIALKYRKAVEKIARDNNIKNIDLIIIGQNLIIE
ncbi:MAG: LysM peptidoglycan-binding domain-containing protein [Cetobacterium sp.]|uniref:LysM peptidoglycan-binding domain-containing protein n=1 Tax=Cetobacterium sp. TaxID=2071632 RepID=UPI003F2D5E08